MMASGRVGHAGAILSDGKGGAGDRIKTMRSTRIVVSDSPAGPGEALLKAIGG